MALSEKQVNKIKEELDTCKNPLFFFDDDQDGLCAFLLLYRYKREGHGVIVKTTPKLGSIFLRKIDEYDPDRIFILDVANVEDGFLESIKAPVVWVDHHGLLDKHGVNYFNPRIANHMDNQPTSYMCYQAVQQDIWIAALGCVADWFIPPFIDEFREQYPDLIENKYRGPGDIIYNSKLGNLIRIFSFALKGKHNDVMKSIKVLTRIKTPYEILNQETSQGKFIYDRYKKINELYEPLLEDVLKTAEKTKGRIIVYRYNDDKTSFTSDLSNEAIYRHPDRIILIGREKNDEMKCSIRSSKIILPPMIEKALVGLNGYGGGHENACGLNIKTADFEEFLKRFEDMI